MAVEKVWSSEELEPLCYRMRPDGMAEVALRRNIERVDSEGDGAEGAQTQWRADEVQVCCRCTRAQAEERFDELWAENSGTDTVREDLAALADTVLALCDMIEGGEN